MNQETHPDCIFCQILQGQSPATVLYRDSQLIVFEDAHPVTPVHVLLVPKRHLPSVNHATAEDELMLGHLFTVAHQIAKEKGIDQSGYRLVVNSGPDAGQAVFHLHMHLIGGQNLRMKFDARGNSR